MPKQERSVNMLIYSSAIRCIKSFRLMVSQEESDVSKNDKILEKILVSSNFQKKFEHQFPLPWVQTHGDFADFKCHIILDKKANHIQIFVGIMTWQLVQ